MTSTLCDHGPPVPAIQAALAHGALRARSRPAPVAGEKIAKACSIERMARDTLSAWAEALVR
jgi:hypothetical protein